MSTTAIKTRPILFGAPMVRAILAGRKAQTRRIVKGVFTADCAGELVECIKDWDGGPSRLSWAPEDWEICPFGVPGDRLWVRETFIAGYDTDDRGYLLMTDQEGNDLPEKFWYRATPPDDFCWMDEDGGMTGRIPWKPSIHMPRRASRLTLEIQSVRVERLQAISEADAEAEGVSASANYSARDHFARLWNEIQLARPNKAISGQAAWNANPWVWAIGFRRIDDA